MSCISRLEYRQHDLLCLVEAVGFLFCHTSAFLINLLHILDSQKQPLLVTKPVKTDVLQVLDADGGDSLHRGVSLSQQAWPIFLQPDHLQPLRQRCLRRGNKVLGQGRRELTGIKLGRPSGMLSWKMACLSFFLWPGCCIPMAVRSSGVILEMVGRS